MRVRKWMIAAACTACWGTATVASAAADGVTLNFATWGSAAQYQDQWLPIVQNYEKLHPGVSIKIVYGSSGIEDKVATMAAAGSPIDVWMANPDVALADYNSGIAADLTPYIQADHGFKASDYFPSAMNAYEIDGHQFGLSDHFQITEIWYNKDLFDQSGLSYPSAWTREQYESDAQKMTKKDNAGKPVQWGSVLPLAGQFEMPWIFSAGGSVVNDLDRPTACTLTAAPALDAYNFLRRLDTVDQVTTGSSNDFYNGRAGMYPYYAIFQRNASRDKFPYGTAPFPAGPAGSVNALLPGGFVMGHSTHPQAAWEFLKYMSRMDYLKSGIGQENSIPSYIPLARTNLWPNVPLPAGYSRDVWVTAALSAQPQMIKTPKANEIYSDMKAFNDAIGGKQPVITVATQVCQQVNGLLSEAHDA